MSKRLPYMPMYWGDYVNHPPLRLCSQLGRSLWPDILKICWEATPRGHFLIGGSQPSLSQFAALVALPLDIVSAGILELEANGVFSRTEAGVIYCRRMVREEAGRQHKAAGDVPTPTEREVADLAVQRMLDADAKRENALANHRAAQARYRQRERAKKTLEGAQAFEAMATAAALSDARAEGRQVMPKVITGDDHAPITVTSPPVEMMHHRITGDITLSEQQQDVTGFSPALRKANLDSNLRGSTDRQCSARSLATLTGGSLAERDEGQGTPRALQAWILARLRSAPIQAPSETDEAFAARCAAAARQADAA